MSTVSSAAGPPADRATLSDAHAERMVDAASYGPDQLSEVRAVVQRVTEARVSVDGVVVGEIGQGLCVLLGVATVDTSGSGRTMATRLWGLRLFPDDTGVMNRSVGGVGGEIMVVSQFTLLGDTSRGRRPSWSGAAPAGTAEPLVEEVVGELERLGATVATGRFGADMLVELTNDGPVTVIVET